jgi:hypothetical protein
MSNSKLPQNKLEKDFPRNYETAFFTFGIGEEYLPNYFFPFLFRKHLEFWNPVRKI